MIELQNVTKRFAGKETVVALHDVSLKIEDGNIFGIVGMSGAGKSTLVRCINLLERPTEGHVLIDSQDMTALTPAQLREKRRGISMIFQQFNLLMQRSCLKNVCFPMEIAGVPAAQARKRAMELLEIVGLPDKADAYPAQLSGGQKQRIAIAGVLAMRRKCIIFDESTAMLDPGGRKEVMDTICRLNREEGITVIHITHYMNEATMADRVLVMNEGSVIMDGTPSEVFSRADELWEAGLDVPQTTELLWKMKEAGYDVRLDIFEPDECAKEIAKAIAEKR